ncbi:hypothetical protein NDU88_001597 [Pleurodeles waltl]|uniref:Uncharacterized protein n=1 Tax=Pleurodeles waltl TaxID=8319 RepID=A0AAV7LY38_PLEWA|nr:hypothetical protein NDU88_001597 [Pleurodeles waltl]
MTAAVILTFPPKGRPPAQRESTSNEDAGSEWSRRSCWCATGAVAIFSVCHADTENQCGALLGGSCSALARGPQVPHNTRSRQPGSGGENRQNQVGGKGVGIPMAALLAAPPWKIPWGSGKPAGNRRLPFSDRGFTAAVRMTPEAPPACWRCFRGRWPWRSMTDRVRMTPIILKYRWSLQPWRSLLKRR